MPIHDWTRVAPGTWHDFHRSWVSAIHRQFNELGLPAEYYAQIERADGPSELGAGDEHTRPFIVDGPGPHSPQAGDEELAEYARRRKCIAIRHNSGDRIVALLELVSPGNKAGQAALDTFVEKAQESLSRGYHLLIVDLFPPGPRDPKGLHAAVWHGLGDDPVELSADEPLALLAYAAGPQKVAYIEPTAVGRALIEMPLFLTPDVDINVPLEPTYQAAYRGVPRKWKAGLEAPL